MYVCQKKVAVLMAAYNGEKYISEQIESVLTQTYKDFCIYIHDDGSKDNTVKIIQKYERDNPGKIVLMDGMVQGGAKMNFIYMLKNVEADVYMFCDQDDVWINDKIEKLVIKFEDNAKNMPMLVYTDLKYVDKDLNIIKNSYFEYMEKNPRKDSVQDVLKKNLFVGCTLMFNRQLREMAIKYKDINNIQMHDWWLGLIATVKGRVYFINEQMVMYRQHDSNVTGMKNHGRASGIFSRWINVKKGLEVKKQYMRQRVYFARELVHIMDGEEEDYIFIKDLSELDKKNKIARIKFYLHNGMMEENKSTLWQMIWI